MNDIFNKAITWVKANLIIVIVSVVVLFLFLFPKVLRGLFRSKRIKHHRVKALPARRRRSLPRSVGMRKRNKPAQYNRSGKRKKPWQIKGSIAARRHMAQIRRMR